MVMAYPESYQNVEAPEPDLFSESYPLQGWTTTECENEGREAVLDIPKRHFACRI
jgi:hypothetical protein